MISLCRAFNDQPDFTSSEVSQSSISGWLGASPRRPKSLGVVTRPWPKCHCHTRFTNTRAVSGFAGLVIHFASSSRPLLVEPGDKASPPRIATACRGTSPASLSGSPRSWMRALTGLSSLTPYAMGYRSLAASASRRLVAAARSCASCFKCSLRFTGGAGDTTGPLPGSPKGDSCRPMLSRSRSGATPLTWPMASQMNVSATPSQFAPSALFWKVVRSPLGPTMPEYVLAAGSSVSRSVFQTPGTILRITSHRSPLRRAISVAVTLTSNACDCTTPRPR